MPAIAKKRKLVVEKEKFDSVLAQLLKMKPMPMKQLRTRGSEGFKGSDDTAEVSFCRVAALPLAVP